MSSSNRRVVPAVAIMGVLAVGLGGCSGFRPLYADVQTSGITIASADSGVGRSLALIDVEPQSSREGIQLRNDLLFTLRGRGDDAAGAQYRLTFSLAKSSSTLSVAALSGRPTASSVTLTASYTLVRVGGNAERLHTGRVIARASFDKGVQRFANIRAERDAEDRAARELAEQIRNSLAAYFARQPG